MNRSLTIIAFALFMIADAVGQRVTQEKYIQVDGIVYDEMGNPLPNISIWSYHLRIGASSKTHGIYSIISVPGDTIVFSAIGLKRTYILTPENLTENRYLRDVFMEYDTISINDVLVLPWSSYSEFKKAVVEADVNNFEVDNMNDNLILIQQQIINDIGVSPEVAYRHVARQISDASYTRNQYPSNNLLNPFAWAKFLQGLKEGLLKNEKRKK